MAARRRYHVDRELTKIDEKWLLSDTSANACRGKAAARAPWTSSALAAAALRTAQEEEDRLLRERLAATG